MNELMGTTVAAVLTLCVYSYLIRDNALYKIAEHLLVAVAVSYSVVVAVHSVLLPRLLEPLVNTPTQRSDLLIPLILGLFLLMKVIPRGSRLGNPSVAYLLGAGLGVAVGGALLGTLVPQIGATMLPLVPTADVSTYDVAINAVVILGTLLVLFSFTYLSRSPAPAATPNGPVVMVGRWFIMLTFGAILGGTILSYTAVLVGRWDFLLNGWLRPLLGF